MATQFKSTLSKEELIDKIRGLIYGNALGDAVGLATEFLNKKQAEALFGKDMIPFPIPKSKKTAHSRRWTDGDWTDDTDQMILIMQGLIKNKLQVDERDFASRLLQWANNGFPELGDWGGLGIGMTVASVLRHPKFLKDPHAASFEVWDKYKRDLAANGAVMRTSILGVPHFEDLDKVIENSTKICRVTHADTRCIASCIAVTTALALMLQGKYTFNNNNNSSSSNNSSNNNNPGDHDAQVQKLIDEVSALALAHLDDKHHEQFTKYMSVTKVEELELDEERSIGYTFKCMGAGFYGLRSKLDFKHTIDAVIKEAGDADTNGAVCGALLGCKIGYSNLPQDWLASMPNKAWLDKQVDAFLDLMGLGA